MTGMSLKISVLIPAYNCPEFIGMAVESALDQDYADLEIIVSDDSSDKRTKEALKKYIGDPRFFYYKNEQNLGRVDNYRKLLYEYATGDWVIMLDGDDHFTDSTYISAASNCIEKDDKVVLVGSGIVIKNESAGTAYSYNLGPDTVCFDGKEIFTKYLRLPNHQTAIYPRKLAIELGFYRHPSMASDSESLYRLCLKGKVCYLAKDVAVWRVHDDNITYKRDIKIQISESGFAEDIYREAVKYISPRELAPWRLSMRNYIASHLLDIAFKERRTFYVWYLSFKYLPLNGIRSSLRYLLRYHRIFKK